MLFSVFKQPNLDVVSSTEQPPPGPKRNAADQMSCELINKKDPPPTPSPAVPISFWEEEARAVPNARGNDGTLLFASFSGRRFR